MSKTFGFVLLGGLLFIIIVSLALLTWVWIRSANEPQTNVPVTPKSGLVRPVEEATVSLVDARLSGAVSSVSKAQTLEFAVNFSDETTAQTTSFVTLTGEMAVACA